MMFKINDLVIYGCQSVCRVEDISKINIPSIDNTKLYYVLKPLYSDGKIYSPVDTNVFIRHIISKEVAEELIDQIPYMEVEVFNNNSLRELNDHYKSLLDTHNCEDLFQLIRTVYFRKVDADNSGKKLGQTDINFMKIAEDLLYSEFAAALEIDKDNVKDYIGRRVEELEISAK